MGIVSARWGAVHPKPARHTPDLSYGLGRLLARSDSVILSRRRRRRIWPTSRNGNQRSSSTSCDLSSQISARHCPLLSISTEVRTNNVPDTRRLHNPFIYRDLGASYLSLAPWRAVVFATGLVPASTNLAIWVGRPDRRAGSPPALWDGSGRWVPWKKRKFT